MAEKPGEDRTEKRKTTVDRRIDKDDRRGADRVITESEPRRKEPNRRSS